MEVAAVPDIDNYVMFYNRFDSVIAYTVSAQTVPAISYDAEAEEMDPVLGDYEVEPEDRAEVMESLSEFTLASAMYSNFLDQACSFQVRALCSTMGFACGTDCLAFVVSLLFTEFADDCDGQRDHQRQRGDRDS